MSYIVKNVVADTLRSFAKSYPFIFLNVGTFVVCYWLVNEFFEFKKYFEAFNTPFFSVLVIHTIIYFMFFLVTIGVCYQVLNAKGETRPYITDKIDRIEIAFKSLAKLTDVLKLFAFYFVCSVIPAIICGIVLIVTALPGSVLGIVLFSLTCVAIVFIIAIIIFLPYLSVAIYMMMIEDRDLATSFEIAKKLLKKNVLSSFFLMLIFVTLKLTLMFKLIFMPFRLFELSELVCLPLHACLTISLVKHLEKVSVPS